MRKLVFILLTLLAGIGAEAQETLIPFNEGTVSIGQAKFPKKEIKE